VQKKEKGGKREAMKTFLASKRSDSMKAPNMGSLIDNQSPRSEVPNQAIESNEVKPKK